MTNCAVDALRARRARDARALTGDDVPIEARPTPAPGPERLAESGELARRLEAALERLSPLERAAFALRHHEGRSIAEIGRALGLGTSATKHSVFRAVRKLRAALGPLGTQGTERH